MNKKEIRITKIRHGILKEETDVAALEQVFSVSVNGKEEFSLRCTPEHLEELLLGHLFTEKWAKQYSDVQNIHIENTHISVEISETPFASGVERKAAVYQIPDLLSLAEQFFGQEGGLFRSTGCAHCCGIVHGEAFVSVYEDIGRHNALDKAVGAAWKQGIPLEESAVFTTGRISGDYLRKALTAGIKTLVSRAAVTSEAISLAEHAGVTMLGFVRGNHANLYTQADKF